MWILKRIILIASCFAVVLLLLGLQKHDYVACPDWDIYVVDQDGMPISWIGVHVAAGDPKVEDQYAVTDLRADAQGHVFVPRRVVRASRIRAFWGVLKQIPLLAHGEVNANGYASIPPPPGYGYPNPGEPGQGGASWYKESTHTVSRVVLYRCAVGVRRYGCS